MIDLSKDARFPHKEFQDPQIAIVNGQVVERYTEKQKREIDAVYENAKKLYYPNAPSFASCATVDMYSNDAESYFIGSAFLEELKCEPRGMSEERFNEIKNMLNLHTDPNMAQKLMARIDENGSGRRVVVETALNEYIQNRNNKTPVKIGNNTQIIGGNNPPYHQLNNTSFIGQGNISDNFWTKILCEIGVGILVAIIVYLLGFH